MVKNTRVTDFIPPDYPSLLKHYRLLKADFIDAINENAELRMTTFRLNKPERKLLSRLGHGNMTEGLKYLIQGFLNAEHETKEDEDEEGH